MVALGTLFSSFWILAANSWMQTPAGYAVVDGRFFPKDWWQIIFNPSFPYRLAHTVCGVLRHDRLRRARRRGLSDPCAHGSSRKAACILSTTLVAVAHADAAANLPGRPARASTRSNTNRPSSPRSKRVGRPQSRVPLTLFAIPDDAHETNHWELECPHLGSLILTHDANGTIRGLKDWPADQRPPVGRRSSRSASWSASGCSCSPSSLIGNVAAHSAGGCSRAAASCSALRDRGARSASSPCSPAGSTTEVGRQPWTVYGLLRTADSVSPSLTGADVLLSFIGYIAVYLVIFPAGLLFMARIVRRGPDAAEPRRRRWRAAAATPCARFAAGAPKELWHERVHARSGADLDGHPWGRRLPLRPAGRLRSRRRHSLWLRRRHRASRNLVMNTIAPVWDGNETWLILGGVGLMAAFPLAFAIIIPAVYFPVAADAARADLPGRRLRVPLSRFRSSRDSGTTPSAMARCWRRSPRASSSAPSSRASRPTAKRSPAAPSTASRRSRS